MSRHKRAPLDARVLERILEITRQLAAPFELTEILEHVVDAGRAVLDAERGTVFLYEPDTDELVSHVATGVQPIRFPADRGIAGECAKLRQLINVPDCYADPRFTRELDRRTGYRTRCLLTLPLIGYDDSLVGVFQLLNKRNGVFDRRDEGIAATLAAQCAVALQRARMTQQLIMKEKLDRELAVAREIQMGVLPKEMPSMEGYDFAGLSRAADQTGGDIFDLVALAGAPRVMLLLGDATGHGIGPALSVTQVRAMLRIALRLEAGLDEIFAHINDQLTADLADNRFVTVFLGELDAQRHRVRYHSGGQGPLLHYRTAQDRFGWLDSTTFPMGFLAPSNPGEPRVLDLAPGDVLGLITDGVFEAENDREEPFDRRGVEAVMRERREDPLSEVAAALLAAVDAHVGGEPQADDITIVLVRRLV